MYGNNILVNGGILIAEALKTNTIMTTISISIYIIRIEEVVKIATLLKINTTLTNFNLEHYNFSEEEFISILINNALNKNLK